MNKRLTQNFKQDPQYMINRNVIKNYLKHIKDDEDKIDAIKEKLSNKGDQICDMIYEQNHNILYHSSKAYDYMSNQFEAINTELLGLEKLLGRINLQPNKRVTVTNFVSRSGGQQVRSSSEEMGSIPVKEINKRINEFDNLIANAEQNFKKEINMIKESEKKIKDDTEYITKFELEKRIYLDQVSEDKMRDLGKPYFLHKHIKVGSNITIRQNYSS